MHTGISGGNDLPDPGGNITNVLYVDNAATDMDMISGNQADWAGQTLCMRYYEMMASNFEVPNGTFGTNDDKIKMPRFHSGSGGGTDSPGFESSSENACDGSDATDCYFQWDFGAFGDEPNDFGQPSTSWAAGPYSLDDIRGEWIRVELCFDHYGAGHPTLANRLRGRGRVVRISDDAEWSNSQLYPDANAVVRIVTTGGGDADRPMHLTTESLPGPNQGRWASAVMMALPAAVDDTFWIGAASEIEGEGEEATCGDGAVEGSEVCDDGDTDAGDGCSATCTVESGWSCDGADPTVCSEVCGNGVQTSGEACDDGGTTAGDGCSATCTVETSGTCGDSVVYANPPGSGTAEECDDGGTTPGDGCDASCLFESGLPFADDFEGDLTGWPNSSSGYALDSTYAVSPTQSVQSDTVSDSDGTGQLNRAWGDAHRVCSSCFDCDEVDECPGAHTNDVWVQFSAYADVSGGLTDLDRKLAQLLVFDDWSAAHGANLQHSVTYISIIAGDFDGDGDGDDLAMNSFRRHDSGGSPISDVANPAGDYVSDAFTPNAWNELVLHAVGNTPGSSDGVFELWVDGQQIFDEQAVDWWGGYDEGQTWNMLLLTDNGSGPNDPETLTVYWDDVTISTSSLEPSPPLVVPPSM